MSNDKLNPIHPGEVLLEEFLNPMSISPQQLATDLNIPLESVRAIVAQQKHITAEVALRLARYFEMSPQFWLGLQMDYDLDVAADALGDTLQQEVMILSQNSSS